MITFIILGIGISFFLVLYAQNSSFNITGQLIDKKENPVEADITVYNRGTIQVNVSSSTAADGSYSLSVSPGLYDIQYDVADFFIDDFFIKLLSVEVSANLNNLINIYYNEYF